MLIMMRFTQTEKRDGGTGATEDLDVMHAKYREEAKMPRGK